jgi:N-acyl homoserine lactone hydrolase
MKSLPMPSAWQGPLPKAAPPPEMAVYQLPTGTYETRAAFAYTGGSFGDKRLFAATAILVTHPRGDFLIDAGFGSDIAAHVHAQPWFARAPYQATRTASEQLDASGYDRGRLHGVLITHSRWDHVSGLDQLQVPIWTNAGALEYAGEARDGKVFRTVSKGHQIHRYEFASAPYLGFPSSYDVHGDGSVVAALAGGHTTGWKSMTSGSALRSAITPAAVTSTRLARSSSGLRHARSNFFWYLKDPAGNTRTSSALIR